MLSRRLSLDAGHGEIVPTRTDYPISLPARPDGGGKADVDRSIEWSGEL
jgi:hypothetical protein